MTPYLLLIHGNTKSVSTEEEWNQFFAAARESGMFRGGSEIGERTALGNIDSMKSTDHIVGYMRFDSEDTQTILDLLEKHPVVLHGGTVELCELPCS
ncbi:MAG: hypothetical protein P1U87_05045 [Verrucomicrobiales bacterium]|nr:hypothetical protein [Verrucomicrobiales bacterium]